MQGFFEACRGCDFRGLVAARLWPEFDELANCRSNRNLHLRVLARTLLHDGELLGALVGGQRLSGIDCVQRLQSNRGQARNIVGQGSEIGEKDGRGKKRLQFSVVITPAYKLKP
jgi:hypothetical protein